MFVIAKQLIRSTNFMKVFSINMSIRNIKPVVTKLVTDNLAKEDEYDLELFKYLEE